MTDKIQSNVVTWVRRWPGVFWTHRIKDATITSLSAGPGRTKLNNRRVVIVEPDGGDTFYLPMSTGMSITNKGKDGGVYISSAYLLGYLLRPHTGYSGSLVKDVLESYNKVANGLRILKYNNEIRDRMFFRPYSSLEELASAL